MDLSASDSEARNEHPGRLMDVGQLRVQFKRLRVAQKRSQESVAKELGITQASLSAFETGKNQSLRTHTLNKLIHLVDTWRGDTNILTIPTDRVKTPTVDRDHTNGDRATAAHARVREKMVRAIKAKMGPESMSAEALASLSWKDLLDVYILSKLG